MTPTTSPLPPLPRGPFARPLRVVVLTCSDLGYQCAAALEQVPGVEVAGIVWASTPRPRTLAKRLRLLYRRQGVWGLIGAPVRKARALLARGRGAERTAPVSLRAPVLRVERFESAEGLSAIRSLSPDLGVVFGTYILRPAVFELPRFGSVNLHCAKLPDYKGAPPAFWELLNGEREIGVTVHRVTERLDAGPILATSTFSLDPAPSGDPLQYADRVWRETLLPAGVRLICEVVTAVALGKATERAQGTSAHPTYRFPDYAAVKSLRRAVRARRAGPVP